MLLEMVELACNQALEHAPGARSTLQGLSGKVIMLKVKQLDQSITIIPQPFGLELSPEPAPDAAVTLAATPKALLKIVRLGLENAELEPGELEIHGDPIIAQKAASIASSLDVDWEELLAEHMGDMPASLLGQGLLMAKTAAKTGGAKFKSRVNKALREDLGLIAEADQVEGYLDDVDELRAAVDQLEIRLKNLLNHA